MKKISIALFAILISFSTFSQTLSIKDTLLYEVGNEMFKFHKQTTTGNGLMLLGGALVIIGTTLSASTKSGNSGTPALTGGMQVVGGGMAIVGALMSLSASRHIGNAGGLLMILSGKPIELKHRKRKK